MFDNREVGSEAARMMMIMIRVALTVQESRECVGNHCVGKQNAGFEEDFFGILRFFLSFFCATF